MSVINVSNSCGNGFSRLFFLMIYIILAFKKCFLNIITNARYGAGFTKPCALLKLDFLTSADKKSMR